ncbi:MAG: DUF167 domain-containing protein [Candidatus Babeliales bacterium]|jgi:hypothetical protein
MAVVLEIKVIPGSGRQDLFRDKTGVLKCHLKNPPEDGKANAELVKMLAKKAGLASNAVHIMRGATSRKKLIKIDTLQSPADVLRDLGVEIQTSLDKP